MAELYTGNIEIVEVSPRDGLQNEQVQIATADKIRLIERAIEAGARRIEVTSFVNPRAVPQMADAEEVCAALPQRDDVTYIGLVMNQRGADRALDTGRIDQLGAVCVATDRFAMANQGQTSEGSVEAALAIIETARAAAKSAQATIAASFGCPFEGEVAEDRVVAMASALAAARPAEIALADTIGVANPAHVASLIAKVKEAIGAIPVRAHFHNTRGTGLANVWSAIGAGAVTIDASIGGLGGCPFAPGAAGNVATEDVVYMLERAGIATGLDLPALIATNHWLGELMGKDLPAMVAKSGGFPVPKTQEEEFA
ncbi:hydroxymethylglutaryl-CoA lyase [Erythrobacter sp. THAF29]|uniref:hydroxymethylglutaryl-CoA lyase n=1 Tax=Erythrobacter sp. THAF29 TaxID=2587851 RepID=UPI0012684071|nr:hydroxymethylglutaryl-CoA lyase [Erythrobacter sp. THAF29]QFT78727.1 Hydroxymethylglutaryl-CoA lyase YngG [Erythrobacter sp. THAF29]